MSGLQQLPVEILYDIFVLALNEQLPHVCRHIYSVFKHSPLSVKVEYLIARSLPTDDLPSQIIRFPICTIPVLETLLRRPSHSDLLAKHSRSTTKLPKRLFQEMSPKRQPRVVGAKRRARLELWSSDVEPIPYLRFLLEEPRIPNPDWNYKDGYPLAKAVMAGFTPLISFLLENGASPACRNGLAVRVAIAKKDLSLVRMLIEPESAVKDEVGRKVRRRRIEDRIKPDSEMLKAAVKAGATDIMKYLVTEKGCVPDMQTVLLIS